MRESQSFFCSGVAPDGDRVAAQEGRQHRGGDAQVDARHLFADAVHVERAAAEAAELLGNEQELDPQLVRAAHVPHDLERALVARVQRDQFLVRQPLLGEIPQRFQAQFQCLCGNHDCASLSRDAALFANPVGQRRQKLQDVVHDSHVRHAEDRRLGVLVDGDDERVALDSRQVLERAADAARQVDLGPDGLAGGAHLPRFIHPLGVHHRPRAAHRRAHRLGQILGDRDIVLLPMPRPIETSTGSLVISTSPVSAAMVSRYRRRAVKRAGLRRFVHHLPARRGALRRPERARADIQHRAGGNIAAHVRAHLPAEFLAHHLEPRRRPRLRYPARRGRRPHSS